MHEVDRWAKDGGTISSHADHANRATLRCHDSSFLHIKLYNSHRIFEAAHPVEDKQSWEKWDRKGNRTEFGRSCCDFFTFEHGHGNNKSTIKLDWLSCTGQLPGVAGARSISSESSRVESNESLFTG